MSFKKDSGIAVARRSCSRHGVYGSFFESGIELHGIKLFPLELAVHITQVDDMSHWTREVVGEKLGLCMDMTIHWNRCLVRDVPANPILPTAQGILNEVALV